MKFNFQVPYNTNIIFTRNFFFFNGYLDINYLTFLRLLMIIDKLLIFDNYYRVNVNLPGFIIKPHYVDLGMGFKQRYKY